VLELVSMPTAEVVQMCLAVERGRMPEAGQSRNRSAYRNRVHLNLGGSHRKVEPNHLAPLRTQPTCTRQRRTSVPGFQPEFDARSCSPLNRDGMLPLASPIAVASHLVAVTR